MDEPLTDRERQERVISAVLKILGVALGIGLTIGLGTWVLVKSLGLDSTELVSVGPGLVEPREALPTIALPQATDPSEPEAEPEPEPTPTAVDGDLVLNASPLFVSAMERVNLTGQWPGQDSVSLLVQRFEDGAWVDFGVQVQVRIGAFATYVMTGREGDNKFRVYDPNTETASNEVTVTIQ